MSKRNQRRPRSGPPPSKQVSGVILTPSVWRGFFQRRTGLADPVTDLDVRRRGKPIDELIAIVDCLDGRTYEWSATTPMFVHTELGRAAKTVRAAAMLIAAGYGPQALVLARTVFESMLYIRWALLNPADADARVSLHLRFAATVDDEMWSRSGLPDRRTTKAAIELTDDERRTATRWFGARGTRSWTGHDRIEDLFKDLIRDETAHGTSARTIRAISDGFRLLLSYADRVTHSSGIARRQTSSLCPTATRRFARSALGRRRTYLTRRSC